MHPIRGTYVAKINQMPTFPWVQEEKREEVPLFTYTLG